MNTKPQPTIAQASHQGVSRLTPEQLEALAAVFNLRPSNELTSLANAERPGLIQNMIDSLSHCQGVHDMQQMQPGNYRTLAMALGQRDPDRLTHVARIEQAALVQQKVDDLAR